MRLSVMAIYSKFSVDYRPTRT